LVLTALVAARALIAFRPRLSWRVPVALQDWRPYIAAGAAGAAVLSPVLYAMAQAAGEAGSLGAPVLWRSSARGMDLLAFLAPNPLHPLLGRFSAGWMATLPEGFIENVASVPWTMIAVVAIGMAVYRIPMPRGWPAWTLTFALLSLGPFVHIAGFNTHIPTPWTLLRYVPIIGAARMPTRFGVLVAMGAAMLFCLVLTDMRRRMRRPALITAAIAAVLLFELLPAPRRVYTATIPQVLQTVKADPRQIKVLNLPFGIRDGLSSEGDFSALYQFHQTGHEKALIGGYLSRLPRADRSAYRESATLGALMRLSGGLPLTPEQRARAFESAPGAAQRLSIGWVVIHTARTSDDLRVFAIDAFKLKLVQSAEGYELYSPQIDGLAR
ncbi:MAG: hypothetical protein M3R55_16985, partial [Acidobacteriota bacterium]|nr:hypothetical protein [Acidobacteriota bacterium]